MSWLVIIILGLVYFVVGIFSVSVGGTALITVPILIYFGLGVKEAVATSMFILIFLSLIGAIGFRKEAKKENNKLLFVFVVLTLIASFIGARLVLDIDENLLQKIIGISIIVASFFLLIKKDFGIKEEGKKTPAWKMIVGLILVFALGIYGGFFSGGYVTILTLVLIWFFNFSFLQSAFATKIINLFSSGIACVVFYYNDLINFNLGIILAVFISLGAVFGVKLAIAKGNKWIKKICFVVIILLAIKLLFLN